MDNLEQEFRVFCVPAEQGGLYSDFVPLILSTSNAIHIKQIVLKLNIPVGNPPNLGAIKLIWNIGSLHISALKSSPNLLVPFLHLGPVRTTSICLNCSAVFFFFFFTIETGTRECGQKSKECTLIGKHTRKQTSTTYRCIQKTPGKSPGSQQWRIQKGHRRPLIVSILSC